MQPGRPAANEERSVGGHLADAELLEEQQAVGVGPVLGELAVSGAQDVGTGETDVPADGLGRRAWEAAGAPGLASKGQAARCRLSGDQLAELDRVLDAGPAASGWEDQRWTLARIRDLIAAKFAVQYTIPGTWYLLRRRGWSCHPG